MTVRICVAGATGWTGRSLVPAILDAADLTLVGAVARRSAGQDVGTALGRAAADLTISATVAEALAVPTDVLIDYTRPELVKAHVLAAIERGVSVVIGTSGLTAEDYAQIDSKARERGVGVIAAGNFSLTAALLQYFALQAAAQLPQWEVIDYAGAGKADVPSGTARELAERMAAVRKPEIGVPVDRLHGLRETRGADIQGVRVHSLRLPGFVLSCEVVFGLTGERLVIRHDAGESATPYVGGTLLAARRVRQIKGLMRGLDTLLFK